MLTKHNYVQIADNWDQETILECCKTGGSDDCNCDCCYDTWQDELNKVNPAYNYIVEYAGQLQNKVDFITSRRDKYKSWVDELDKAETLARDICHQLKLIAVQSEKIWYNSCKAVEAIDILFCMIRDIFMQIDKLKTLYDSLQNCITRNNDPCLVKGQGILKYLDDYKTKLDATVKTRDDIIKNIIDAIRIGQLIRNNISTKDCPCKDDPPYDPCADNPSPCATVEGAVYYGFKTVICEWYNAFACDVDCTSSPQTSDKQYNCDDGQCELKPTFDFPICNNSFKIEIQTWVDKDNTCLKDLIPKLNKAKMQKEALAACKTSLISAIKAVNPMERCK